MKRDTLEEFISLRNALEKEKQQLEKRLAEINKVFRDGNAPAFPSPTTTAKGYSVRRISKKPVKRIKNEISLREAVKRVLNLKSLSRKEIVDAVQRIGYKFATKDPMNSLSNILYGRDSEFKNVNGKFTLAGNRKTVKQ